MFATLLILGFFVAQSRPLRPSAGSVAFLRPGVVRGLGNMPSSRGKLCLALGGGAQESGEGGVGNEEWREARGRKNEGKNGRRKILDRLGIDRKGAKVVVDEGGGGELEGASEDLAATSEGVTVVKVTVPKPGKKIRLDRHMAGIYPSLSRTYISKLLKDSGYSGKEVVKEEKELSIRLFEEPATAPAIIGGYSGPNVAVLDKDAFERGWLVVDKPPGLLCHTGPGHWNISETLVAAVAEIVGEAEWLKEFPIDYPSEAPEDVETEDFTEGDFERTLRSFDSRKCNYRAGIVHRLDMETSGCMVVGLTSSYCSYLSGLFKGRKVAKTYLAILRGAMEIDSSTMVDVDGAAHYKIENYIGRDPKDRKKYKVVDEGTPGAKRSLSYLRPLCRSPCGTLTLASVRIVTGRSHQIRVQCSSLGFPVMYDGTYGRAEDVKRKAGGGGERQMLHSYAIKFEDRGGREVSAKADIPQDMNDVMDKFDLRFDEFFFGCS